MAKYNIPNLYIANRDRASSGGGSDPQLESRVEALETTVDGTGGLTDQVDDLDEQINGDSTATPPVPGIVDEIEALEVSVFGDSTATPPVAGLEDRVTALENASGGATYTNLWENADPTQSFVGQDITLSSGEYDMLMVLTQLSTSGSSLPPVVSIKGEDGYIASVMSSGNAVSTCRRSYTYVSDTKLTFGDCTYHINGSASTTDNARAIPRRIYGIKF